MARQLKYTITADSSQASKEFDKLEKKVERTGKKISKAGKELASLTAPFAAIGAIATKQALAFENAFSKIRVGTGATGTALNSLVKDFEKVNKQVSASDATVAQALADINTRLGLTGSKLSDTTKSFVDLGRILGSDTTALIKTASQAMDNWGISANDTTAFLDKLYAASYTMGIGVDELANSVSAVGGTFRNAGIGINETIAIIASFEKAGLSAQSMVMPLNTAMANLAKKGCTDLSSGLVQVISSIKNAKSSAEAVNIAVENFGRRGANLATAIRDGRLEIDDLVTSLKNSSGALAKAANDTMTTGEKFKLLKKQAEVALQPLGEQLLKIANDCMPAVQKSFEWLGSESGMMATKIGLITAAFSGMIVILGTVVTKAAEAAKAIKTLTVLMSSNPYVLAAITGGITVGYLARKTADAIPGQKQQQQTQDAMLKAVKSKEPNWGNSLVMRTGHNQKKAETLEQAYNRLFPAKQSWTYDPKAEAAAKLATVSKIEQVGGGKLNLGSTGKKTGKSGTKSEDYSEKLSDAILDYNNSTGINNAVKQMDIYAQKLAKISTTTGTAKEQTEAWQKKLQLTNSFGSAMSDRIDEISDAFEKGNIDLDTATEQLSEIGTKYQLTAKQSEELKTAIANVTEKANENTAAFMENAKAMQEFANDENLKKWEQLYNSETAFGGTASKETAQGYIAVLEQMRDAAETGSTAWQQLGEKIREVNEATLGVNVGNIAKEFENCKNSMKGLTSSFAIGFSDAIADAITGAKDFNDSINDLLTSMAKMVLKATVMAGIMSIFTKKPFFGEGGTFMTALGFHEGGVVGKSSPTFMRSVSPSIFSHAPRLHTGNLRADEYPAILQKGETVIPKSSHFGAAGTNDNSGSTTYNVTIQAVDSQSFVTMLQKNKGSFESMLVNSIQRGGGIRSAIKGAVA